MKKRNWIIIILIILILGIAFWLIFRKRPLIIEEKKEPTKIEEEKPTKAEEIIEPEVKEAQEKASLSRISRSFIERWFSYSSDSAGQNFIELLPLMTENLQNIAQSKISEVKEKKQEYQSNLTKVLTLNLEEYLENQKARFKALVQQEEKIGEKKTVTYPEVEIILIKVGEEWKVSQISNF